MRLTASRATGDTATIGQVGNLGITASEETEMVNFLKILTDGYTTPNRVTPESLSRYSANP